MSHSLESTEIGSYLAHVLCLIDPFPEVRHKLKQIRRPHTCILDFIMRHDDIKFLFHDLSGIDEIVEKLNISNRLLLHELAFLAIGDRIESFDISLDIYLERSYEDLDRKLK